MTTEPTPPSSQPESPYRLRPADAAPVSLVRTRPRGALVAALLLAGVAVVVPTLRRRRAPTLEDAPGALLRSPSTFPAPAPDLGPATPLAPLLAADEPESFTVIEPAEGSHRVQRGTSLWIRFNRPMVRAEEVDRPLASHPLRFTPAVAGVARWSSRNTLRFDPAPASWARGAEVSFTVDPTLRSMGGEEIGELTPRTLVFDGGTHVSLSEGARRVLPGEPLRVRVSGPVDLAALRSQVLVYEAGGAQRPVPFTLASTRPDADGRAELLVQPNRTLEPGTRIAIAFAPGVAPQWEGSDTPGTTTFELAPRPRIEGVACPDETEEAGSCEFQGPPGRVVDIDETLRLWATNPLATPLAGDAVRVTPTPPDLRVSADEHTLSVEAEWEPGQVYEVRLGALRDREGHALGTPGPLAIRSRGRAPEVRVASGALTFERDARAELPFAAVHIDRGDAWHAEIPTSLELRAALDPNAYADRGPRSAMQWRNDDLAALLPAGRAHRWARGAYAWRDGRARGGLALVRFDANRDDEAPGAAAALVQQTDLGIHATALSGGVLVWVTSLHDATPVEGAALTLADHDAHEVARASTDAAGVAWIALADGALGTRHVIRAVKGDDRALMVLDPSRAATAATLGVPTNAAERPEDAPVASVWTDRGAYRPGESMHVKAVVRRVHADTAEAVRRGTVRVALVGPDGEVGSKRVRLSNFGSVDADFALPVTASLGEYSLAVWSDPIRTRRHGMPAGPVQIGTATVRVGEFRQPTVRVDLEVPSTPVVYGERFSAGAHARYLFGAPMTAAHARWSVQRDGAAPHPARWTQYTFSAVDTAPRQGIDTSGQIDLDAQGAAIVTTTVTPSTTQRELASVEFVVRDASGDETSAWRTITVYPADVEVGVRDGNAWTDTGAPLDVESVVIGHDDAPVANVSVVSTIRREGWHTWWEWQGHDEEGDWQARRDRRSEVVHRCATVSTTEPSHCTWMPDRPGTYVLESTVTDARGRRSVASRRVYVAAPGEHPDRDAPGAPIAVTSAQASWFVGDRARVAFECPWPEADALITVHRETVLHAERRRVRAGGVTVEVPITREMVPNAFVTVTLVRPRTGAVRGAGEFDLQSPDLRWGATELTARPQRAPLAVAIQLGATSVRPDTDVPIDVTVRDERGEPVSSEVALYAVDEGSLRLTNYTTPDPTRSLLPRRAAQFALEDLRRQLVSRIDLPALPGASGDGDVSSERELRDERDLFDPTPLWLPRLTTDARGHAHATLHVPSRNTQYRVIAVAIDQGLRAGGATANVTASRPVVMRPMLPRTLTDGDHAEAAVFLHNASEAAVEATLVTKVQGVARASRVVRLDAGQELRVTEPIDAAGSSVDVAFEVTAGGASERLDAHIPVAARARQVRTGSVGAVQGERALTIDLPDEIDPSQGSVTVTVATHPFAGVDGAMEDLLDAPWGGTEATAATLLGWASLASLDVGLRPARWSHAEVRARGERAAAALLENQSASGGFGAWSASDEPSPYVSTWALRALVAARRAGFDVPREAIERAASYVTTAVQYRVFSADGSSGHDELAFALRTLSDAGRGAAAPASALYDARDALTPFGLAQLAMALPAGDTRRDTLLATALRRAGAWTPDAYRDRTGLRWYASTARTAGAMLEAVATLSDDLHGARTLAATLLDLRLGHDGASWGSTHETASALAGLAAWARRFQEGRTLDAALTLDGAPLTPAAHTRQGARYVLPVSALGPRAHRLIVRSASPAFFALDGRWAVPLGDADTVARGRAVAMHRVYETAAGTALASGAHVHLGDLVRVRLFVYSESATAPFSVLRDPMGGGFEAVDRGFATTPQASLNALLGGESDDGAVDPRGFYAARSLGEITHRAFDRGVTRFVFDAGATGLREFTYAVRATTVGTFTLPPAQFDALYDPSQRARSTATTLVVDP